MVQVSGNWCPNVTEHCKEWIDDKRCKKFDQTECLSTKRTVMNFCIDREEYTAPNETIPQNFTTWVEAKDICESEEKRLCTNTEWTFACEGEDMLPYPYGYTRSAFTCYTDTSSDLLPVDKTGNVPDLRVPYDYYPRCLSPFGVHNMVGNVDEWVNNIYGIYPFRSGLRGGWYGPMRNRCRAETDAHNEWHEQVQIGFRCCKDL